jgi:hypothetical protein
MLSANVENRMRRKSTKRIKSAPSRASRGLQNLGSYQKKALAREKVLANVAQARQKVPASR